jgi:dipeptidyl-peptidase 4
MSQARRSPSQAERYLLASECTAPRVAMRCASTAGYWLSDNEFFFVKEEQRSPQERPVAIPSIADCSADSITEVMPLEKLASLMARSVPEALGPEILRGARVDMPDRETLAVSLRNMTYLIDTRTQRVLSTSASAPPALHSPDGRYACYIHKNDLWLRDRSSGAARPLTTDGAAHRCYGQEPETNLAAVSYRKRKRPVGLWSPDSEWFLTHRIDERDVPELGLMENSLPGGGRPILHRYAYPMVGDPLPEAQFVAIHPGSGRTVLFEDRLLVSNFSPFSMGRVWHGHGERRVAFAIAVDRFSKVVELCEFNLVQGTSRLVLREQASSGYLNLNVMATGTPNVCTLVDSDEVIWFSERDGWGHLYLYDGRTGSLKNQITRGNWVVRDIVYVDERRRRVLFLACGLDSAADPAWRSLCSIDFEGLDLKVLLAREGDLSVPVDLRTAGQERPFGRATAGVSPDGRFVVVNYGNVERGDGTQILDLARGTFLSLVKETPRADGVRTHRCTARAADGVTVLHGVIFLPSDFEKSHRYPLIDYIYPGPQVTHQPQYLDSLDASVAKGIAELGFVTLMLDTRGMPTRSRSFQQLGYGSLLEPQLADHAAVVQELSKRYPFIDGERIGILGQSAGGAAAARALFDYGTTYKVGVAVCGDHAPRFYSSAWSDKYRGPPPESGTWSDQDNTAVAHKLSGHLLLIAGDMDENVHVSQTLALADTLIGANRDFELLIVPNAGHDVLMTDGYTIRRIWDFFVRHLLKREPPNHFHLRFRPEELERYAEQTKREARR